MTISREELRVSARKGLGSDGLAPPAEPSWQRLVEMGWFALAVPEAMGGLGLGPEALAAVHIELGCALVPGAAIAQMAAIEVLAGLPPFDGQEALVTAAIAGDRIGLSLALHEPGSLSCVPDADLASHMLIVGPDRIALAGIASVTARPTWDLGRRLFDVVPGAATELSEGAMAAALYERALSRVLLALAADAIGAAGAILEQTVDYLNTRRQFDRPLALFQALKHRVADMKIAVAAAEALLWSLARDGTGLGEFGMLKTFATTAFRDVAEDAVQLHGGIGLTAEYPCHLFLKRAFLNAALAGDADHWNAQYGAQALSKRRMP